MSANDNPTIRTRPVFKAGVPDDSFKSQPAPAPTGSYPYRLDIEKVIPAINDQKMVFHMIGDTGTLKLPAYQRKVAAEMTRQCNEAESDRDRPQFLFHLGDVVYNFGEAEHYYDQFFDPYRNYPNPVFAISGNHDADVDLMRPNPPETLEAFLKVFCDTESRRLELSGDAARNSNIQPNVYWTLQTPLGNFIGLYSNVTKFGLISDEQKQWFIEELKAANAERPDKALIVCVHHAPYSADVNHGSSRPIMLLLNDVFETTGILPDAVFSGHVHNYQRFTKTFANGQTVPFIVAGAGGYADLHPIARSNDPDFPDDSPLLDNVKLEKYSDSAHGFLKVTLERTPSGIVLSGKFYSMPGNEKEQARLYDSFEIDTSRNRW